MHSHPVYPFTQAHPTHSMLANRERVGEFSTVHRHMCIQTPPIHGPRGQADPSSTPHTALQLLRHSKHAPLTCTRAATLPCPSTLSPRSQCHSRALQRKTQTLSFFCNSAPNVLQPKPKSHTPTKANPPCPRATNNNAYTSPCNQDHSAPQALYICSVQPTTLTACVYTRHA